jgi:hypothetical protein
MTGLLFLALLVLLFTAGAVARWVIFPPVTTGRHSGGDGSRFARQGDYDPLGGEL